MKYDKNIVISLKFKGIINMIDTFNFFKSTVEKYSTNKTMELAYTVFDKSGKNWKFKSRGGKLSTKVVNNFKENISQINENIIINGFSLSANLPDWNFKAIDVDFCFYYTLNAYENFCSFDIVLLSEWSKILDIKHFVGTIYSYIVSKKCEIQYGFMFIMESRKNPLAIIDGHFTQFLTKYEEKKIGIWSDNKDDCNTKIWDIFWGNIISKKHLEKISIKEIEKLAGKENVYELSPNVLWFNLPENLMDFDFSDYSKIRKKLYKYFDSKNLIMTE
jgi:hypothetical protein